VQQQTVHTLPVPSMLRYSVKYKILYFTCNIHMLQSVCGTGLVLRWQWDQQTLKSAIILMC